MVTNLIRAPLLVLLSDVDGLFDGDPREPGSKLISDRHAARRFDHGPGPRQDDRPEQRGHGQQARGGARIATMAGENVIIASGRSRATWPGSLAGERSARCSSPRGSRLPSWKRWIGFTAQPRGHLMLDAGARRAIEKQGRSLLAIGVVDAERQFQKGGRRRAARRRRRASSPAG